jgi:hypothetical protein
LLNQKTMLGIPNLVDQTLSNLSVEQIVL